MVKVFFAAAAAWWLFRRKQYPVGRFTQNWIENWCWLVYWKGAIEDLWQVENCGWGKREGKNEINIDEGLKLGWKDWFQEGCLKVEFSTEVSSVSERMKLILQQGVNNIRSTKCFLKMIQSSSSFFVTRIKPFHGDVLWFDKYRILQSFLDF